ncbi:MAG: hypothetical protein ACYDCQ_06430 [Dehalococcoidia bacterium]
MRIALGLLFAAVICACLVAGGWLRRTWLLRPHPWSIVGLLGLSLLSSASGLVFAFGKGNDGIMVLDAVLSLAWLARGLSSLRTSPTQTPRAGRAPRPKPKRRR